MHKKEIKKLLDNLEYCNNYIKSCKTNSYKKVISNTKFYELKNCIMIYILRNAQKLGIELGCCIIQSQGDKTLVLIPVIYNNNVYEFHQMYKDIEQVLLELNIKFEHSETEYKRPIKQIDEDIDKFDKCITQIKHYVWNHYKQTLGDPRVYVDKPMMYMKIVELCNKHLKFDIFTNGALMKYHITARLSYKGIKVAQKPLAKIRKNIFQYIALKNENNSGKTS